ncbi:HigA family addiction module antitoxin [Curtobacterium sp. BRD11]|uniref:HigA family addiction module antitoxin n=1 Tax=Curtobacterium sp. BRD11 TaxID=2962581 RepID=UPI002880D0EF|nr:HigA family addiction module antitoxin [Curtobacterium sp. BRD11]MDT0212055.1 HigA family addiction module antitoxin [Curtobacterium sp. BRD11]
MRNTDWAVAPGETLRVRLEEIDMTQAELARRTSLTPKHINQIVRGSASVSADVAQRLEMVTGTPAHWWLRLEASYRERLQQLEQRESFRTLIPWMRRMPIKHLVARGYLRDGKVEDVDRVGELLRFFGVANKPTFDALMGSLVVRFRQTSAYSIDDAAVAVWLRLGELAARELPAPAFRPNALRTALPQLRALTQRPVREALQETVTLAASFGLRIVFVEDVPGTRAYGVTRWFSASEPVVQLSLRGRTDDKLWETLFHELGHVLLHGHAELFVETDPDDQNEDAASAAAQSANGVPVEERQAQEFAYELLIPSSRANELLDLHTPEDVLDFAEQIGVAPSVVVARLQHVGLWDHGAGSRLKQHVSEQDLPGRYAAASSKRRGVWGMPGDD